MLDKKVISDSIKHYGAEIQTTVCMEELAELIQAISKEKRGQHDVDHLAEEIADVLICIEMIKQIYNVPENIIDMWVTYKQRRILERMGTTNPFEKMYIDRSRV